MSRQVQIQTMTMRHYAVVLELWKASAGVHVSPQSDSRPAIARYLRRNPRMSQVALKDGKVLGAILCGHDGRRGILHHLAVARDARRLGLGKALVDAALAQLKQAGIEKCWIMILADNAPARRFWKAIGWEEFTDAIAAGKVIG